MSLKDRLYNWGVRKNQSVQYEYERYVMEHTIEHYEHRLLHWKILWRLNWHYRVRKNTEPLLYYNNIQNNNIQNKSVTAKGKTNHQSNMSTSPKPVTKPNKKELSTDIFPESKAWRRPSVEDLAAELSEYDVISFDLFDTLVFRCFSDPGELFWLVGNDLFIPNFKNVRKKVERELRGDAKREVTIDEIYELLSKRCNIEKEQGVFLEYKYEKQACFANPYMYEIYKILKKYGKKVIVTSNMYWNKEYLDGILRECGYLEIDEIFVSCDFKISKEYGKLQQKITQIVGEEKKIIHVGDNYYMDIEGSRMAGWKAIFYKNVNKIGQRYRPSDMTNLSGKLYNGLVNSKLHNGITLNPYYEFGYAYAGYLICGFCKWLNKLGKLEDVDKFLFVSRDMYVVEKAYRKWYAQFPFQYIKASRTSAIHLSFDRQTYHFIQWHLRRRLSYNMTIREVLEEMGYTFLEEKLSQVGLNPDEILSSLNFEKLETLIFENKDKIVDLYEEEKKAAAKYYVPIIGDAKKICIVDLGWKASTARSLEYFFKEYCNLDVEVICAMFGMEGHEYVGETLSTNKTFAYMFSDRDNKSIMQEHNRNGNVWRRMYEMVFTSTEPSLLGFKLTDQNEMYFQYLRDELRDPDIITNMQQGMLDFVNDFVNQELKFKQEFYISSLDAYWPLYFILNETEYNYELFKNFEVCFIAGNVGEEKIELFRDVVNQNTGVK